MKATKIVATLGPASDTVDIIATAMIRGRGRCVPPQLLARHAGGPCRPRPARAKPPPASAGAKLASWAICEGRKFASASSTVDARYLGRPAFILDAALDNKAPLSNSERASLDYKQLPRDVKAGDTLLLADGLIQLTVDG